MNNSRLTAIVCSLFLASSIGAQEVGSVDLRVEKVKRNLSVTISPEHSAQGCQYELFAGRRASKVNLSLAKITGDAAPSIISVSKLPRLKSKRKRVKLFFSVTTTCPEASGSTTSKLVKIKFRKSKKGKVSPRRFLKKLANKFLAQTVSLTDIFSSLTFEKPIDLQFPRRDSTLAYVVEQTGKIKVFNTKASQTSSTFLDLSGKISTEGFEQGLLGLALHPQFLENQTFFVHYSRAGDGSSVVSKFNTIVGDPTRADLSSEVVLITAPQPYDNHNGGQIAFGHDGYLYIALGDGGSGGDPLGNGQNLSTLLGSILRIDVDAQQGANNYKIPTDNPFTSGQQNSRPEIYAYGLRNPWRFSFDSLTGDLWAADVGQNSFEEINIIRNGANYGWNSMEGEVCYPIGSTCDQTGLKLPVFAYPRDVGTSVTGGMVYRGVKKALAGKYLYADFINGKIWSLFRSETGVENNLLLDTELFISAFGQNTNNEIFILSYFEGKIFQLK